ncbi:MAG: phage virion morphogenesis protein, partial [Myxococcota bacterium]|nr:phage virion morphogenesis protein [Myxococcota bacterium]
MEARLDDRRGFSALMRDVRAMKKRLSDVSPAAKSGAEELQKVLDQTFAQNRSPDGQPWPALKPSTVAEKGSTKPLVETGALRAARRVKATSKGFVVEVAPNRAQVARILSSGMRTTPARPVLPRFTKGGPAHAVLRKSLSRIARFV